MTGTALFGADDVSRTFAPLLEGIAQAAVALSRRIALGSLAGDAIATGVNADGDRQVTLDVVADSLFREALGRAGVRWYASEEQDEILALDPKGSFAVALDPLDGSSNVDTNLSVGTIFSAYPALATGPGSLFRPLREQVLAGYVIYGPRTIMVVTWGEGVHQFLLDPETGRFLPLPQCRPIPPAAPEFAINASNYRHWPRPVRAFVDDCVAGAEGPRECDFNMRWLASLVAEAHRILARGGVFLYPEDQRPRYGRGRLRLLYECAPLAWVIEQAGGRATDGRDDILDGTAAGLHDRTPFVFGSRDLVARMAAYYDLPDTEVSALFGQRGLFRA